MLDWKSVPMPPGLAKRPLDARGYPITYVTLVDEAGVPDFTTLDGARIAQVAKHKLCGLCGGPLRAYKAFIGGPLSIEAKQFTDPPSCRPCAEYALAVCPFLAITTARYRKLTDDESRQMLSQLVSPDRPTTFGLYITKSYRVAIASGTMVFVAGEATEPVIWTR